MYHESQINVETCCDDIRSSNLDPTAFSTQVRSISLQLFNYASCRRLTEKNNYLIALHILPLITETHRGWIYSRESRHALMPLWLDEKNQFSHLLLQVWWFSCALMILQSPPRSTLRLKLTPTPPTRKSLKLKTVILMICCTQEDTMGVRVCEHRLSAQGTHLSTPTLAKYPLYVRFWSELYHLLLDFR